MLPAGPRRQTGSPIPDRSGRVHPNPDFQQRYAFTFLELFARGTRRGWAMWGNQADDAYEPTWDTYAFHSRAIKRPNGAVLGD